LANGAAVAGSVSKKERTRLKKERKAIKNTPLSILSGEVALPWLREERGIS
jgi:hypothetical protein